MRIRILGCSGGVCANLRSTALLVDDDILIDCGTGVGDLTLEEMAAVHEVFLTHSHLDHVLILPLLSDAALGLRDGPITVHALAATLDALKCHIFNGVFWPDYTALPTRENAYIRLQPLVIGETVTLGGRNFTAMPARHTVPAVGYLLDSGYGSFAFSGDTTYCEAFWEQLNTVENLQYLMVETTMRDADAAIAERSCHTTPSLLLKGLKRLKRRVELLVTHIEPDKVAAVREEVARLCADFHPCFVERGDVYTL